MTLVWQVSFFLVLFGVPSFALATSIPARSRMQRVGVGIAVCVALVAVSIALTDNTTPRYTYDLNLSRANEVLGVQP